MYRLDIFIVGFWLTTLFCSVAGYFREKPCAAKQFSNRSIVCVCNATYCDTITREPPHTGRYMAYISTEAGFRFQKRTSILEVFDIITECSITLELDPRKKYQTIHGFGGAITDSAGLNWSNLKDEQLKQNLINTYCSESGIQYNMLRVPIGGTDFSSRIYTYQDYPEYDKNLSNFTLAPEDLNYKLPMIKACMKASKSSVNMLGSLWSPPAWMKDTHKMTGISFLMHEYYDTLALYYLKFIKEYYKNGVSMWGVTSTNEPLNGVTNFAPNNVLGWSIPELATWIIDYLRPTIKYYDPSIKILGVDDQRYSIPIWFSAALRHRSDLPNALEGIALHSYGNVRTPPELIGKCLKEHPHLFVLSTESCIVPKNGEEPVELGSWKRAEMYTLDIIEDLNYNYTGWIDWNVCLNKWGGPVWSKIAVDSPVIVDPEEGVFYKQPMFYAIGHFSKFIPPGSMRISSVEKYNCGASIKHVAFLTPKNTIVVVILNDEDRVRVVRLKLVDGQAKILIEKKSITTVEFNNDLVDDSCDCEK